MRFRGMRLLGSMAFSLFIGLSMPACSGQQQGDDEVVDASDQQGDQANESGEEEQVSEDQGEETNNTAEEGNNAEGEDTAEEGNNAEYQEEVADGGGNATENDLQEIIQEMNGQQGNASADAGYANPALAQEPTNAGAVAPTNMAAEAMPAAVQEAAPATAGQAAPATETMSSTTAPFQPGGSPAGQGLPEIGSKMAYIVQSGDTLAKIATKIYGNNSRWKEMANLSGMSNPSRIYPGDVVYYTLDEKAVAFATAYESVQRAEEMVKPGDTLATIAQRVYGSTHAWKAIWRQNDNISNPDVVAPGSTVYYIPTGSLSAEIIKVKAQFAKINAATVANGYVLATGHTYNGVLSASNLN